MNMEFNHFQESLSQDVPPQSITPLLKALWWDAKGEWDKAHTIAQDIRTPAGSLIHAYLHRKEGNNGNAGYWYSRAGESPYLGELQEEWQELVYKFISIKD